MNEQLKTDELEGYISDFLDDHSAQEGVRDMANEEFRFITVAGGHWEGWLESAYEDRAKLEIDHTADYVDRTFTQWTQARQTVNYAAADDSTDDGLSDTLDGLIRRDMQRGGGQASVDTAVREAICPGMGCVILNTEFEDEGDPENENQNIVVTEQPNAYSTVFFDTGARRADKLDARHCTILTPYSRGEFEYRWPDVNADSLMVNDRSSFNWSTKDLVYVGTRYHIDQTVTEIQTWANAESQEVLKITRAEAESEGDELAMAGFKMLRSRKVKRKTVYKTVFTGSDILEPKRRIAGEYIPVIAFYGNRAFVDGVEYFSGIVRKRMDAQRIMNMSYSLVAESAAHASESKPIFDPKQMRNPAVRNTWAKNGHQNAYHLAEAVTDQQGNPVINGPVGYTQGSTLSQSAAALVEMSRESLMRGTGGAPQDTLDPDASGKAMNAAIKRIDLNTGFIFDNIGKSIKHLGLVYQSIAKEVYSAQVNRSIRIITNRGESKPIVLNQMQGLGGKTFKVNDLSKGKFEVIVDTSKDYQSAKEETFESLKDLMMGMNPQSPMRDVLTMHMLLLKEGSGLEDLQEFVRNQQIQQGYIKPETDEEVQMLQQYREAQQNAPQDANALYLEAEARKAESAVNLNLAKTAETSAKAVETAAQAEETKIDIALKKQQLLQNQNTSDQRSIGQ